MKNLKINYLLLIFLLVASSCASRKDVVYFQNAEEISGKALEVKKTKLKPNDRLSILVTASDQEVVRAFTVNTQGMQTSSSRMYYTISESGEIVLPYVGKIKAGGLTRLELVDKIRKDLEKYIKDPVVNVTLENFQVTLLGFAQKATLLNFENNDRPTVLEAIAMGGDTHITAKRNEVLVIREEEGVRNTYRLDLRDVNLLNSPAYYLSQNDIVYIEPNNTGIQGSKNTWYLTIGMTFIAATVAILNLLER